MANKSQDERFDDIAKGQVARVVHSELSEIVYNRESIIINAMVMKFNSNTLTEPFMVGSIARIAELRNLVTSLENQIKSGIEASQNELSAQGYGHSAEDDNGS